jgi:hypothetical protein
MKSHNLTKPEFSAMKISTLLASVACSAVLLANSIMANPIGPYNKRATTNNVNVGYVQTSS